jgi:hypothetical protein
MSLQNANLNLLFAWIWMLAGFVSGALLGLRFASDQWLGGYASFRRRMYRLGHISFFGLGFMNLAFALTVRGLETVSIGLLNTASWTFLLGALSMPVCCLAMAHRPNAKPPLLFALPVGSLLIGALITLWMLIRS